MRKYVCKIKNGLLGLVGRLKNRAAGYLNRNWKNTATPMYWITMVVLFVLVGSFMMELFYQPVIGFVIGGLLAFLIGNLVLKLLAWVIRFLGRFEVKQLLCMGCLLLVSGELAAIGNLGNDSQGAFLLGICWGLAAIFLGKSVWAFFKNKVHSPTVIISGIISGVIVIGGCVLLGGTGFSDTYIDRFLAAEEENREDAGKSGFEEELKPGSYTVESVEYGVREDAEIMSETVNLSFCAKNADGITGLWRKLFTGYDVKEAPIAGKVWYPKEISNCPVLFFAHGNHGILTESYQGYAYLGEYLASHGYVVVSVDENVLNILSDENDARAVLLLENIKKLQEFNREEGNPLFGKMDYENIVIGGHSRGGEMAATAYLFNGYDCYPENGKYKFYYQFNIRGVIAVAPSVNQYMPAGHAVELENVNYLLLQGANDQDINIFLGNTQYENVKFTEDEEYIKSSLYISGANHGQFNSLWGTYDIQNPIAQFLNVENFLSEDEQQMILKVYTKVFLDKVLKNDNTYADLLTDYQSYADCLPQTVYIQQHQESGGSLLCDFEEDSNLVTGSEDNVSVYAGHMYIWREEMLYYSNETNDYQRDNHALRLSWKETNEASYTLGMKEAVSLGENGIAFDICDRDNKKATEEDWESIKPQLVVCDTKGNEAVVCVEEMVTIYPPLPIKLGKLQYLTDSNEYKHQYQTVHITAEQIKEQCHEIELSEIESIRLEFPKNNEGDISVDNIWIDSYEKE